MTKQYDREFDVLLSFAGPQRAYARAIHDIAVANGLSVFLDEEFRHEMWGQNLVEYLDDAYRSRGDRVVILLSEEYRDRLFTRVERRAAFDRMLESDEPYVLPVITDDAWISGLPRSTSYLDLRVHGVIGVCEMLVRKVHPDEHRSLTIPDDVLVPRVPTGEFPAEQFRQYLSAFLSRESVAMFGVAVYDDTNVAVRKLFRDQDYWDALDQASGPRFEVFAARDSVSERVDYQVEMMTAMSMSRNPKRHYFSSLAKELFGTEVRLSYPSLLMFVVENGQLSICRNVPLGRGSLDETYEKLRRLLEIVSSSMPTHPDTIADLWDPIRDGLLDGGFSIYKHQSATNLDVAVDAIITAST